MFTFIHRLRQAIVPTIGPRPREVEDSRLMYESAVKRLKQATESIAHEGHEEEKPPSPDLSEISQNIENADKLMRDALNSEKNDE